MAQKRLWEWQHDDLTIDMDEWLSAQIAPGTYCGFDFSPTADLNLTLIHSVTGFKFRKKDLTMTDFLGEVITQQGVIITEDAPIILPIAANNSNNPRIDIIVLSHLYDDDVVDGRPAEYSVVTGTPSATPVAPSVADATTDIIIATLYLPGNTTLLNAVGVVYTKPEIPNFARVPNNYTSNNYLVDGENIQKAAARLDVELFRVDTKYETNTYKTPVSANGTEASRYSKILTIGMPSVGDSFSAVLCLISSGNQGTENIPLFGIFEINVRQEGSFGTNPVVNIKCLSGNMASPGFLRGKITGNSSPSGVEFYIWGANLTGQSFAVRYIVVNKSTAATVTYNNLSAWALLSGTIRDTRAKKIFKGVVSANWPADIPSNANTLVAILNTPNDGKRRSFTFECDTGDYLGGATNILYLTTPEVYYTSFGGLINQALVFGSSPWTGNGNTQSGIFRATSGSFIDVDPGTTMYMRLGVNAASVLGYFRLKNLKEIDRDEYDFY